MSQALIHIHPAGSSLDLGEDFAFCGLQQHHHLLPRDGGKVEIINRVPSLQVLEEGLDGHARSGEDRGASHDVWRNGYRMIAHEKEPRGKSGLLASGTASEPTIAATPSSGEFISPNGGVKPPLRLGKGESTSLPARAQNPLRQ